MSNYLTDEQILATVKSKLPEGWTAAFQAARELDSGKTRGFGTIPLILTNPEKQAAISSLLLPIDELNIHEKHKESLAELVPQLVMGATQVIAQQQDALLGVTSADAEEAEEKEAATPTSDTASGADEAPDEFNAG